jgi:DNA invertase Pin-like site-specific DNA recombinase
MASRTRLVGYVRVSTDEQEDAGGGLAAQRAALAAAADRDGWSLIRVAQDVASGATPAAQRPGLFGAITAIERGEADGLVVSKLDRLSRSLHDFAAVMERAQCRRWRLVALDLGVDTATPQGEMMAGVLALFAQFERRLIGQRTREALAAKRAAGVRLGRPPSIDHEVAELVLARRADGAGLQRICDELNEAGVPTPRGGRRWRPSSIRCLLRAADTVGDAPDAQPLTRAPA